MHSKLLSMLANECGIDLIGIVDMQLLEKVKLDLEGLNSFPLAFYRGNFADRTNVKKAWEETKGIISFAMSYNTSLSDGVGESGFVRFSKATFGLDYHSVLKGKAEMLMNKFIEKYPCNYKIFVDTGVLSDRLLAYCAGLGFYGKNHFIVNEKFGSFIFLGHILTDIELASTVEPADCMCGDCNICIKICPENAYDNELAVNYEKCISYLNQKGREYDKTDYIYGCDICQNSCPFNINAPKDIHSEFSENIDNVIVPISDIIDMNEEAFEKKYAKSAMAWRGLKTLKKNCKTVLSRKGNRE